MTPAEARQALGLSQQEMAKTMNVHYMTWRKWERGEREPDNAAKRLMGLLVCLNSLAPETLHKCLAKSNEAHNQPGDAGHMGRPTVD